MFLFSFYCTSLLEIRKEICRKCYNICNSIDLQKKMRTEDNTCAHPIYHSMSILFLYTILSLNAVLLLSTILLNFTFYSTDMIRTSLYPQEISWEFIIHFSIPHWIISIFNQILFLFSSLIFSLEMFDSSRQLLLLIRSIFPINQSN